MTTFTKDELMTKSVEELVEIILEMNMPREQKSHKKFDALAILKRGKPVSIMQIAEEMNISTKNVSSLLTYLRKDGHEIMTDHLGRKVLNKS